jgi:hypothetical protein
MIARATPRPRSRTPRTGTESVALLPTVVPSVVRAMHMPSTRPMLVVHRTMRTDATPTTRDALLADATLSGAWEVMTPAAATAALQRRMHTPRRDRVLVHDVDMVSYLPGEQCVLRFMVQTRGHVTAWMGIVHAQDRALRTSHTRHRLWNAGLRSLPKPLGVVPELQLRFEDALDGEALLDAMHTTRSVPRLADAVLRVLRTTSELPVLPEASWSAVDAVRLATRAFDAAARTSVAQRGLVERLHAIAEPLRARCETGVIYRTLRPTQLLLRHGRIRVREVEQVAFGDPALDVGALIGHLIVHGWQRPADRLAARALAAQLLERAVRMAPESWAASAVSRYACLTVARCLEESRSQAASCRVGRRGGATITLEAMLGAVETDGSIAALLAP